MPPTLTQHCIGGWCIGDDAQHRPAVHRNCHRKSCGAMWASPSTKIYRAVFVSRGGVWSPHPTKSLRLYPAETAVAALVVDNGLVQLFPVKIRPQGIAEIEFTVGTLPQQEVGKPQLAAGADDQFRIGNAMGPEILFKIFLRPCLAIFGAQAVLASSIIRCSLGDSAVASPRIRRRI